MASSSHQDEGESTSLPPALVDKPAGLPPGKYKLVGWDIDTTGRRLIDEICHIAAFIPPDSKYSQFIMPYGDLNPGARRRNNVRVVTVGRYRMLKENVTHKVVKTKSEVKAHTEFLNWLEAQKKEDEMVILIYHEPRRLHPIVILQAMTRYRLLERFKTIVAGFTDSYVLCSDKCQGAVRYVTLRLLSRLLLEDGSHNVDTALDRAIATYNIVEQLANQEGEGQDMAAGGVSAEIEPCSEMMDLAIKYGRPINTELNELESLKNLLVKQNTFRSVIGPLLRCPRPQRRRLTHLRRILADAGLLFDEVKDAWHEGHRPGLERLLEPLAETVKAEDIQELLDIFDCHFDPEKEERYPLPSSSTSSTPSVLDTLETTNEDISTPADIADKLFCSSDSDSSASGGVGAGFLLAEGDLDYYD